MGRCDTCRFWQRGNDIGQVTSDDHDEGWCRRHAPHVAAPKEGSHSAEYEARWPVTWANDWCGEYMRAPRTAKE